MKIIKPVIQGEERIVEVGFNIFKFTNRSKPVDSKRILILTAFSEFGCETVSVMYCMPKVLRQNAGKYTIVVGWYGRAYLYKHLVDEFWEVKEEYQWLRDYAKAFHHDSKNLAKVEEKLKCFGNTLTASVLGQLCVINKCTKCNHVTPYTDVSKACRNCGSKMLDRGFFTDVQEAKKSVKRIPKPLDNTLSKSLAVPMSVGIFARARKTYGRNLQPEFYIKLIDLLEKLNYKPIWLGEKQNTLPCPVEHIVDFSRMPESRDLETTLSIISKCVFTIQFWTASTRLAGMLGVPYILAESPDQIWGNGQEGYRRNLCDFGPSKLIVSHYMTAFNDNDGFLEVVRQAIKEVESGKYEDLLGQLETNIVVKYMKKDNAKRIGGL